MLFFGAGFLTIVDVFSLARHCVFAVFQYFYAVLFIVYCFFAVFTRGWVNVGMVCEVVGRFFGGMTTAVMNVFKFKVVVVVLTIVALVNVVYGDDGAPSLGSGSIVIVGLRNRVDSRTSSS